MSEQDLSEADQAALEQLRKMAQLATEDHKKCVWGEHMLYLEHDKALMPGHIYSMAGIREARISGSCEYHFDRSFKEGWVDPVTGEPGLNTGEDLDA